MSTVTPSEKECKRQNGKKVGFVRDKGNSSGYGSSTTYISQTGLVLLFVVLWNDLDPVVNNWHNIGFGLAPGAGKSLVCASLQDFCCFSSPVCSSIREYFDFS